MTNRELRGEAYKAIIKEHKSHQEAYEQFRGKVEIKNEVVAEEIAKIPSRYRTNKYQKLIYFYVAALALIIILRTFFLLTLNNSLGSSSIGILIIIGIAFPVYGIFGAITSRIDTYRSMGIIIGISLFRSFSNGRFSGTPEEIIGLIPFIVGVILAFYIPTVLKSRYTKEIVTFEKDGIPKEKTVITFENSRLKLDDDLLDSGLSDLEL